MQKADSAFQEIQEGIDCLRNEETPTEVVTPATHGPHAAEMSSTPDCKKKIKNGEKTIDQAKNQAEQNNSEVEINCYCHDDPNEWAFTTWVKDVTDKSPCERVKKTLTTLRGCTDTQTLLISTTDKGNKILTDATQCLQIDKQKISKLRVVWFKEEMHLTENTESLEKYEIDFKKTDLKEFENADKKNRGLAQHNAKGKIDFMLLIDEPDDKAFNTQREALKKYLGIGDNNPQSTNLNEKKNVKQLSISNNEIKDLIIHEGSVHHVYNDAKRANSKYCNEHNGHPKLEEHSYSCDNDKHRNNEGRLGYPTIGVGHLIVGETELQKYCNSTITQTEIENLLTIDIIEKAEKPLKKLLNSISSSIQLTQCQYDALTSIVFNRGEGRETSKKKPDGYGFKGSDLWKDYLKNGVFNSKDPDIADKMRDALVNDGSSIAGGDRRNDEAELYFNCKYKNK